MPSDDVDDSKVVEDFHVPSKAASIIEDISIGSGTTIINEAHMSFDSTSNDVNEIIDSNIPKVSSRSFEFPCADYRFMVVPAGLFISESSEFLAMTQQRISGVASFTGCLKFVPKSSIPPFAGIDVCPPKQPRYIIFSSLEIMPRVLLHCICLLHILIIPLS